LPRALRLPLCSNGPRETAARDGSARRVEQCNIPCESWVAMYQPCCTTASKSQRTRLRKAAREKDVGPTRGFVASPGVGPGATVGTMRTGYPCVQALSQDKRQGRACVLACPRAPAPASRLSAALGPSRVPVAPAPASQLRVAPGPPRVPVALAPATRLRGASGPPRVAWAPAPAFWLMAALKLPRVLRTCSTSCKQLNKYALATRAS
jgi:hypothetical protein